ncbi:unnamed protein product, partial [Mesorhabditis belari]|uniref:RING-type domain-containing protein n=1 Tax=Mesorhabditis belari TaxID=2138241 RepID=A0AAF3ERL3_9BILA
MILLFIFILLPSLFMAQFDYTTIGYPEEYSLWMNDATAVFNEIFTRRNYNRFLAPLYGRMPVDFNSSNVARLHVDMILRYLKVFGLDAENQIISFFCEFEMSWVDPRLSWSPEHFNDTKFIFVTADLIWTPDNQIGNTKSLDTLHPDSMKTIVLSSNGTIHMSMVYFAEVACVVEISRFPFDNQTCAIPVAAMALDLNGQYSSMSGKIQNVNVFNLLGNGEWDVSGVAMIPYQFLTDTVHTLLLPTIFLKRVPNYYVYVIALPGFILTMLGIFGMFWTPHIRKEQLTKLSIGLTTLVAITEMRVFESLSCILCKQPYARVANQRRSPRQLGCGLAMCDECFEQEEMLEQEERNHQCGNIYCFYSQDLAYFLIDVLSQESALMFTPMGYLLVKPFKIPECPICHDEYSNEIEAKKSFALQCGHIICTKCCLKTQTYDMYTAVNKRKDRFHDFLNELPEMTRQMETMMNVARNVKDECSCNECHKKNIVDEMFYCGKCVFEICAVCAYKRHHPHGAIPLLEKEANKMLMEVQQESRNVIKTYKDLVPELHKGLLAGIDIFEMKLLSKEETLKDVSTFADFGEKHESFTKIKSKFESSAENYLRHLCKFDAEVKQLIQTLNESPDVSESRIQF